MTKFISEKFLSMASRSCSYALREAKIGCEVFGIDLKKEVTEEVVRTIKNDVKKHRILVFRDQGIVPPQRHLEISRWFGEVESTFYNHPKSPHRDIFRVSNDREQGCTGVGRTGWHIDGSFMPKPFSHSIYHIIECPKKGATVFLPLTELIERLNKETFELWNRLYMVSDSRRPTSELNPHPLIYKHPETRKLTLCFHLGMTDSFILDHGTPNARELDDDETETILRSIHSEIVGKNADLQYKHEWQPGDFIISDNLALGHEASPETQSPKSEVGLRIMHRVTIAGKYIPKKDFMKTQFKRKALRTFAKQIPISVCKKNCQNLMMSLYAGIPKVVALVALRRMLKDISLKCSVQVFYNHNGVQSLHTSCMLNDRARKQAVPLRSKKTTKNSEDKQGKQFTDCITVQIKAGNGGDGKINLCHKKRIEFAGPDGGNGGNGGHVLFKATKEINSLSHLKRQVKGQDGTPGGELEREGKCAEHRVILVPVGTIFRDLETREVIAELTIEGSMFLAAKGGAGGKGNAYFKSAENKTPMLAEVGGKGEEVTLNIELSTMAHVGLIGLPNAGKSTLLRAVSRARPRVAAYPFTTLTPHIGMVPYDDYVQISVADIPGIIPDAHKNKGLGISFLRHIERCLCLLYVVDVSRTDAFADFQSLRYELDQYRSGLSGRMSAIIANKMDLPSASDNISTFMEELNNDYKGSEINPPPVFQVSGKLGSNIQPLLQFVREIYDEHEGRSSSSTENIKLPQ